MFELHFERYPPPAGTVRYALVPWDSEVFGHPFFDLDLSAAEDAAFEGDLAAWQEGLRNPSGPGSLVVARTAQDDIGRAQLLARRGFYPVEVTFELLLPLGEPTGAGDSALPPGMGLRPAVPADRARLREIALAAFSQDRFHLDPNLDSRRADERFRGWITRSLEAGEEVLAYEDAQRGVIFGFFNYREINPTGIHVGLAAVDREYQATDVVLPMFQAALERCRREGYETAAIRIAGNNTSSLNLAISLGFMFRSSSMTWHWWSGEPGTRAREASCHRH